MIKFKNAGFYRNDPGDFKYIKGYSFFMQVFLAIFLVGLFMSFWYYGLMKISTADMASGTGYAINDANIQDYKKAFANKMAIFGTAEHHEINVNAAVNAVSDSDVKTIFKEIIDRKAQLKERAKQEDSNVDAFLYEGLDEVSMNLSSDITKRMIQNGYEDKDPNVTKADTNEAVASALAHRGVALYSAGVSETDEVDKAMGYVHKALFTIIIFVIANIIGIVMVVKNKLYVIERIGETLIVSAIMSILGIVLVSRSSKNMINGTVSGDINSLLIKDNLFAIGLAIVGIFIGIVCVVYVMKKFKTIDIAE